MQENLFSLSTDGSNDNGVEKMNPLSVRIFDIKKHCVSTQLLDMCLTSGPDAGKEARIFEKIDKVMISNNIPWLKCIAFSLKTQMSILESTTQSRLVLLKRTQRHFSWDVLATLYITQQRKGHKHFQMLRI